MPEDEELGWDEYFAEIAEAVATKSKDPNCKVGAVIVNTEMLLVASGFNGLPRTLPDDEKILADKLAKLDWVVHAEHNAVLNAARQGVQTSGCAVYVNKFPCFACLGVLVQAGIKRIYTTDHEYWKNDPADSDHSGKRFIIKQAGLEVVAPNHPEFKDASVSLPDIRPGLRKAAPPPSTAPKAAGDK